MINTSLDWTSPYSWGGSLKAKRDKTGFIPLSLQPSQPGPACAGKIFLIAQRGPTRQSHLSGSHLPVVDWVKKRARGTEWRLLPLCTTARAEFAGPSPCFLVQETQIGPQIGWTCFHLIQSFFAVCLNWFSRCKPVSSGAVSRSGCANLLVLQVLILTGSRLIPVQTVQGHARRLRFQAPSFQLSKGASQEGFFRK